MTQGLPDRLLHADWSVHPRKRWLARAIRTGDGRTTYLADAPEPVGETAGFLRREAAAGPAGCVLVGLDLPIGLPAAYARAAGITSFLDALAAFGHGRWARFYDVAERPAEIGPERPFYPMRPGGTSQRYLLDAHGAGNLNGLRRRCELGGPRRRAASPLFWTLGGNQVGKAALAAWREVLAPALRDPNLDVAIWPFAGDLPELLMPGRIVVAETYPGEVYYHLGIDLRRGAAGGRHGKRQQGSRIANAPVILDWFHVAGVDVTPRLRNQLENGCGADTAGEDRFDAVVGLCGLLEVALGLRPSGAPLDPEISAIEGWILGTTTWSAIQ